MLDWITIAPLISRKSLRPPGPQLGAARFDGRACAGQKAWWSRIGCDVGCTVAVLCCCTGSFAPLASVGRPTSGLLRTGPWNLQFQDRLR
jgi:hypothetical protein